ncbi:MAG: VCBS repeat-containing protein, partial [Desulfamplus sp.]|nr:VCBS repeat-containing protein [Desulfamplus sp.]
MSEKDNTVVSVTVLTLFVCHLFTRFVRCGAVIMAVGLLTLSSRAWGAEDSNKTNPTEKPRKNRLVYNNPDPVEAMLFMDVQLIDWDKDGDLDFFQCPSTINQLDMKQSPKMLFKNVNGSNLNPVITSKGEDLKFPNYYGEIIDWDGDGDHDFIARYELRRYENTGSDSNPIWVDRGKLQANGKDIISETQYTLSWVKYQHSPRLTKNDWDNDDKDDLMISVYSRKPKGTADSMIYTDGPIYFYKNIGTQSIPIYATGIRVGGAKLNLKYKAYHQIVDWDGDGDLDIMTTDYRGRLMFFERTGPGVHDVAQPVELLNIERMSLAGLVVTDLDSDGDLDVVIPSLAEVLIYKNTGSRKKPILTFQNYLYHENGIDVQMTAGSVSYPDVVDWDNDGDDDLVMGNESGGTYLYENIGKTTPVFKSGNQLLDKNGDRIRFNNSGGTTWGVVESEAGYSEPCIVDWDNDGDLDIIFATGDIGRLYYCKNIGTRKSPILNPPIVMTLNSVTWESLLAWRTRPCIVDYDNDGDLDLIRVGADHFIRVYTRDGSDTNLKKLTDVVDVSGNAIRAHIDNYNRYFANCGRFPLTDAKDIDGNGLFDFMGAGGYRSGGEYLLWYRNVGTIGNPVFSEEFVKDKNNQNYVIEGYHEQCVALFDYNNDGKEDLIDIDLYEGAYWVDSSQFKFPVPLVGTQGNQQISTPTALSEKPLAETYGINYFDAWNEGNKQVATMNAPKWYNRTPYFGELINTTPYTMNIFDNRQSVVDMDIAYAAHYGVDYFAFYSTTDLNCPAEQLYLTSKNKPLLKFCMIKGWFGGPSSLPYFSGAGGTHSESKEIEFLVARMKDPQYFTVLDGRPLLYWYTVDSNNRSPVGVFGSDTAALAFFKSLRVAAQVAGLGNPYVVVQHFNPNTAKTYATAIGGDAINTYSI